MADMIVISLGTLLLGFLVGEWLKRRAESHRRRHQNDDLNALLERATRKEGANG